MGYGDIHKIFLRSMWTKGIVTLDEAKNELLRGYPVQQQNIERFIHEINTEIEGMKQQIKVTPGEDGEDILVFVSLGNDGATRSQNIFSVAETEFFRVLMNEITGEEDRAVTGIDAVNLVNKMNHKLQKSDAERLLRIWTHMRYIQQDENAYVLGPRTMIEFLGYLQKHMEDPPDNCSLCQTSVFKGVHCQFCGEAVHHRCIEKYVKKVHKWPCCRQPYDPDAHLVQIDDVNTEAMEELPPLDLTELYEMDEDEARDYRQKTDQEIKAASRHAKRKRRNEEGKAGSSRASSSQAGPSRAGLSRAVLSQGNQSQAGPSRASTSQARPSQSKAGPSQSDQSEAGPSQSKARPSQCKAGPSTSKALVDISDDSSSQQSQPDQRSPRIRKKAVSKTGSSQDDSSEESPTFAEIIDEIAKEVVEIFDESLSSSDSSNESQPHLAGRRFPDARQSNRIGTDSSYQNLLGAGSSQRRPLPNEPTTGYGLSQVGQSQAGSLQHKILKARTKQVNPSQDGVSQADILACRSRVDSSPRFPTLYSAPVEINLSQLNLDMDLYEAYAAHVSKMETDSSQSRPKPSQPQPAPLNIIDIGLSRPGRPLTYPEPANSFGSSSLRTRIFQAEQQAVPESRDVIDSGPSQVGTPEVCQGNIALVSIIDHSLSRPGPSHAETDDKKVQARAYPSPAAPLNTISTDPSQLGSFKPYTPFKMIDIGSSHPGPSRAPAPPNIIAMGSSRVPMIKTEPPEEHPAPWNICDISLRPSLSHAYPAPPAPQIESDSSSNTIESDSSQLGPFKLCAGYTPYEMIDIGSSHPGPSRAGMFEVGPPQTSPAPLNMIALGSSKVPMVKMEPPEDHPSPLNICDISLRPSLSQAYRAPAATQMESDSSSNTLESDSSQLGPFKLCAGYTPYEMIDIGSSHPGPSRAGMFEVKPPQTSPAPLNMIALGSSKVPMVKMEPPEDHPSPLNICDISLRPGPSQANPLPVNTTASGSSKLDSFKLCEGYTPFKIMDIGSSQPGPLHTGMFKVEPPHTSPAPLNIIALGSSRVPMIKTEPPEDISLGPSQPQAYPLPVNTTASGSSQAHLAPLNVIKLELSEVHIIKTEPAEEHSAS